MERLFHGCPCPSALIPWRIFNEQDQPLAELLLVLHNAHADRGCIRARIHLDYRTPRLRKSKPAQIRGVAFVNCSPPYLRGLKLPRTFRILAEEVERRC